MDRKQWNLLVLAAAGGEPLQPVQLQKALFLLGRKIPPSFIGPDFYSFEPYNYGPFDLAVYSDASSLAREGLAIRSVSPHGNWHEYAATQEGIEEAERVADELPPGGFEYIKQIVDWVRGKSFTELVRAIYQLYPETQVNSVFRG